VNGKHRPLPLRNRHQGEGHEQILMREKETMKIFLSILIAILTSCNPTESKKETPYPFRGIWANMESFAEVSDDKDTYFEFSFLPEGKFSVRVVDFDMNPATGKWEIDSGNSPTTHGQYDAIQGYETLLKTIAQGEVEGKLRKHIQAMHWSIQGDSLFLKKAIILKGTSNSIFGSWESWLDTNDIQDYHSQESYAFRITNDSNFTSHLAPGESVPMDIFEDSFVVKRDGSHNKYGYRIKEKNMVLTLESEFKFRLKKIGKARPR
jgi:hypothetical protein